MKGNVMDMAVGVIIGGAFGKIVTSMVNDVLMPVISLCTGGIDFTNLFVNLTPDVVIEVKPDRTDLVESRIVDGRQCLVIAVDDHIEVNGINVRTFMDR